LIVVRFAAQKCVTLPTVSVPPDSTKFSCVSRLAISAHYVTYGPHDDPADVNDDVVRRPGQQRFELNWRLTDFNILAANFGMSTGGPMVTPSDWAALASAVPEPTLWGLVLRTPPADPASPPCC
jgi:hypothetical protein